MTIFKKKSEKKETGKTEGDNSENIAYLNARREYSEVYGSYIQRMNQWRSIAFICAFAAVFAVVGLVYIGSISNIAPYMVHIKDNRAYPMGYAEQYKISGAHKKKVVLNSLMRFIENFRQVTPEKKLQEKFVAEVYSFMQKSMPAYMTVNDWYERNNPFKSDQTILCQITYIVEEKKDNFRVEWTEKSYDGNSKFKEIKKFKGTIEIKFIIPKSEREIIKNPLGIYIENLYFSSVFDVK